MKKPYLTVNEIITAKYFRTFKKERVSYIAHLLKVNTMVVYATLRNENYYLGKADTIRRNKGVLKQPVFSKT